MFRRTAKTLLFGLGLAALLLLLLDCVADLHIYTTWPRDDGMLAVSFGTLHLSCTALPPRAPPPRPLPPVPPFIIQVKPHPAYIWFPLPDVEHYSDGMGYTIDWISVPLWLICAVCLAWPVTSFIISRRKGKRGFPIESISPQNLASTQRAQDQGKPV